MAEIGATIESDLFIPVMEEQQNSENSPHAPDGEPVPTARHEADHNNTQTANGANGSIPSAEQAEQPSQSSQTANGSSQAANGRNPSSEQGEQPSQVTAATIEELWIKLLEVQAVNDTFRNENLSLNRRLVRITTERQEDCKHQLELITHLQDEIQALKEKSA